MKKEFVSFVILFFLPLHFAFAGLEINEIMYDLPSGSDSGREWVEIFNNSDKEVDTSKLRFFEGDTNHKLVIKEGEAKIPIMGYAVIISDPIKFKADWPSFKGNLFDSTFSLGNTGEALAIKDGDIVIDQYAYSSGSGAAGNGKSLQKIAGTWVQSVPTPGQENKMVVPPPKPPPPPPNQMVTKKSSIKSTQNPESNQLTPDNLIEDIQPDSQPNTPKSIYLPLTGLISLVGFGAGLAYFVRRKKTDLKAGDGFEIID